MKNIFASSLVNGDDLLNEPFMIQDINRRKTKDGRAFLLGSLRDKTGQVAFIFWDVPSYIEQQAKLILPNKKVEGVLKGIDDQGALLMSVDGDIQHFNAGEISLRVSS